MSNNQNARTQYLRGMGYELEEVKGSHIVDGWWRVSRRGHPVGGQHDHLDDALTMAEKHATVAQGK